MLESNLNFGPLKIFCYTNIYSKALPILLKQIIQEEFPTLHLEYQFTVPLTLCHLKSDVAYLLIHGAIEP